jgi:hypothetical protein
MGGRCSTDSNFLLNCLESNKENVKNNNLDFNYRTRFNKRQYGRKN